MFEIIYLPASDNLCLPPNIGRGRICIEDFEEEFEIVLEFWSPADYRRQWVSAIERLLEGHDRASLITSMTDPATANFLWWWPAFRIESRVFFYNQILFLEQLREPFNPTAAFEFVEDRERFTEEQPISEWSTSISSLRCLAGAGKKEEW